MKVNDDTIFSKLLDICPFSLVYPSSMAYTEQLLYEQLAVCRTKANVEVELFFGRGIHDGNRFLSLVIYVFLFHIEDTLSVCFSFIVCVSFQIYIAIAIIFSLFSIYSI